MRITINGIDRKVQELGGLWPEKHGHVSYDDLVEWSGRDSGRDRVRIFTVTYTMPHGSDRRDGSLTSGESVPLEDGTIFEVTDTSNA